MSRIVDLTGQRFGLLIVEGQADERKHGQVTWLCRCDCGTNLTVLGANLRKGNTTACGCTRRRKCADRLRTHGESTSPEFEIWCGIKKRCSNPADKRFH